MSRREVQPRLAVNVRAAVHFSFAQHAPYDCEAVDAFLQLSAVTRRVTVSVLFVDINAVCRLQANVFKLWVPNVM